MPHFPFSFFLSFFLSFSLDPFIVLKFNSQLVNLFLLLVGFFICDVIVSAVLAWGHKCLVDNNFEIIMMV